MSVAHLACMHRPSQRLIEQYGRESNEFIAGLHVLDAALPNVRYADDSSR